MWLWCCLYHHIALDHTAFDVVLREMQGYLLGHPAPTAAPMPYRNYVAQARLGVSEQEHETFFRTLLGDVDEPTLPFGLQNVRGDGNAIEEHRLHLDSDLNRRLRAQARLLGVSTASLFHLAWGQVLAATSGRQSVVFGTVLVGRLQGGEGADRALGVFINTLPLRLDIDGQGARSAVRATHARLTALLGHRARFPGPGPALQRRGCTCAVVQLECSTIAIAAAPPVPRRRNTPGKVCRPW